jgi:hypothetical protein
MMRVTKSNEINDKGPTAGKNCSWKNFCFLMTMKKPRVSNANANGIPGSSKICVSGKER